ncbi:BZ3500_MvSof-1268-A1-R1_C059g00268 [Microbotryum saponariae]|uniref:BZ3500_MvSof-1268-A1-R1_C059g00268 protein n=1 Tax=Microbotryum saponariae TaxID=289078 RepID=A0A2X0MSL3_9BASI|nr:BZ3500_MvSof-1268-A1-R1_C059g00268 [Microbotryum saponariae]
MSVVQIARWPTRWHPSFAPNRSVTCRPYSAITMRLPRQHHRGVAHPCPGLESMQMSLDQYRRTSNTTVDRWRSPRQLTDHSKSHRRGKLSESVGTCIARLGKHSLDARSKLRTIIDLRSISPPVRAHPITKTCEVTTRSPIAMATASTVDLQLDRHGLTVIN